MNDVRVKLHSGKEVQIEKEVTPVRNSITGDMVHLYVSLKRSFQRADQIDIIVSFLMESGVKLLLDQFKDALKEGKKIRILTGNYLGITQPSALYMLKRECKDKIELRFYNNPKKSFHPKAYIFHGKETQELYIGSSNISKGALTDSIEWNYRLTAENNPKDYEMFCNTFEDLFMNHAYEVTDTVLRDYSRNWKRPRVQKDLEQYEIYEKKVVSLVEPRGAQLEALYALEKTREEGFDKGIVVAATGIGKTYLAAFDSRHYSRVLFVAHREEILKQAADSFFQVRETSDYGYFYSERKELDKQVTFAMVQTLGKEEYLKPEFFKPDSFDYVIIDECHHAVAKNYQNIINYFKPKFLLALTATPERMDAKNVFELCDYNCVYEVRLREAINKGWLVPFRYYGIYDQTVNYENITFTAGKYNEKELEVALMLHERSDLIYNHYKKYKTKRAIGFCSSRAHAKYMADAFCERGIHAVAVYSGDGQEINRVDAINGLKAGEINVIFSVDMFNEGLDVKAIDLVMFLRPTESPTVFLQQLGRGLRKSAEKDYLNVLDFIGNFKKANLIPYFLSGQVASMSGGKISDPREFEFPEECYVDFDFQLIDLFKKQSEQEKKLDDRIVEQFVLVMEQLGHVPSRMEFFTYMDDEVYELGCRQKKRNPFKHYLEFLEKREKITQPELELFNSFGGRFIDMIETTSMSKSYKMPLLLAFYNGGKIKKQLSEEDVYHSFYEFYHAGTNKADMLKDKATSNFESWAPERYVKLAKDNPIKFMLQTHGEFFKGDSDGCMELSDELNGMLKNEAFVKHMKDAIDYRVMEYYRKRFENEIQ